MKVVLVFCREEFFILSINLDCLVKNNDLPSLLTTIVLVISNGPMEWKFLDHSSDRSSGDSNSFRIYVEVDLS